jgi:glycosyltransferase involved in cell wall biosynthesis
MPDVLLLCEYATLGGGERSMLATLNGVRQAGFAPAVLAPPEGPLADALRARDVEVLPWACRDSSGAHVSQDRLRSQLARLLRQRHPDLLHANSLSMGRLSGPVAAELQLPSIGHLRDIVRLSRQAVADLNCHSRLLAVSQVTRQFHVAAGLAADKVHVLPNGADLEQFRPRPPSGHLHRELGIPPEAQLIATIGQISLRKGQDVLVRAALRLAHRLPNVHYLIVGRRHSQKDESRSFEAELRAAAGGPLAGRLHFLGQRDDVAEILPELTLLVHPARQEPLSRVLLESAAAGAAVIATDVGGTREIFPPQSHSARLVPPDDPDALAAVILDLLGDESLRSRLAAAARRRAEEAFDVGRAAEGLLQHYRELTSAPRPSSPSRVYLAPSELRDRL